MFGSESNSTQISNNVIPTQTQVAGFVKNGQVDLHQALDEVYRRSNPLAVPILNVIFNVSKP